MYLICPSSLNPNGMKSMPSSSTRTLCFSSFKLVPSNKLKEEYSRNKKRSTSYSPCTINVFLSLGKLALKNGTQFPNKYFHNQIWSFSKHVNNFGKDGFIISMRMLRRKKCQWRRISLFSTSSRIMGGNGHRLFPFFIIGEPNIKLKIDFIL